MKKNKKPSFEDSLKRLEEIVQLLESTETSLEEGMKLYREGCLCSRQCREQLAKARHELEIWENEEFSAVELTKENNDFNLDEEDT